MITIKRLVEGTQLTGATQIVYTAPANGNVLMKKLTFTNTDVAIIVTLTVFLVPAGGGAGASNQLKQIAIQPLQTYECFEAENHMLAPGDALQTTVDSNNHITAMLTGAIITN